MALALDRKGLEIQTAARASEFLGSFTYPLARASGWYRGAHAAKGCKESVIGS